ncbi:Nitrilotriacetate monooxygenase component A/pristinamycin IIA synthase subunit A [Ceraceosorus guamensis]|uniref:Nitrilotriacetate monooxygenase component A/pristinamycin IIA synthase subunit A n=1 Tax=Ceraceosorus guamensis TaxID=1522189 RepID=A0A316VW83_9BASI|nr:Nitrilotriacetate monooxygenase component A/pristinamycin IIA synthase subunit A [Ceraceosorus guamensis]PWN39715.1 Nitrilotriacetate monooxygenase component A/pristinamycin IIA synthase subunit A [Ceraceosorus guamensis]
MSDQKRWLMFAFAMGCSGHQSPGSFAHPADKSIFHNKLSYWTDLAKLLEGGKFDGLFLADVWGGYDVYTKSLAPSLATGSQIPLIDPLFTVPAMATATKHLTFGLTATTSYEHPYSLARRFSTLDHLTNGRVGWNVVTGYLDSAARQFGARNQELHAKRYEVAHEYMDVVYKLWESSWADDAVKHDISKPLYADPERVRDIKHKGQYYEVPGPHICEPSLQRTPVIFQAGSSGPGLAFAGKHAEVIFIAAHAPQVAKSRVDGARKAAAEAGRDPKKLRVLALLLPIVGKTDEEAEAKHRDFLNNASEEGALALFGGWTGIDLSSYAPDEELRDLPEGNAIKSAVEGFARADPTVGKWTKSEVANQLKIGGLGPFIVGSASTVANKLEEWVNEAGVDGFNLAYAISPGTFLDTVQLLVPELQKRGHMWSDYPEAGAAPSDWPSNKKTNSTAVNQAPKGFGEDEQLGLTAREKLYGAGNRRLPDDHYGHRFR